MILAIHTIIARHSTNWLVFKTETDCVLCEAGTSCLYITENNVSPQRADLITQIVFDEDIKFMELSSLLNYDT